jgi:hypothetical protein
MNQTTVQYTKEWAAGHPLEIHEGGLQPRPGCQSLWSGQTDDVTGSFSLRIMLGSTQRFPSPKLRLDQDQFCTQIAGFGARCGRSIGR